MSEEVRHQPQLETESYEGQVDEYGIEEIWLKVRENGKMLAWLEARSFKTPMKLIWVRDVGVVEGRRGNRFSSMLLRAIEQQMLDSGAAGILHDLTGIFQGTPKQAEGMYRRHNWRPLHDIGVEMVFNAKHGDEEIKKIDEMLSLVRELYQTGQKNGGIS